jgi:UDP-glucose 4-epimerase
MRIIVTGGAGFIGSHIVEGYLACGHEVVIIDSLWAHGGGRRDNIPQRASFVHADIRDESLERVFREFAPDVVSHHAAQHSVAFSSRDPQYDAQVNVLGLLNVLENCVKAGVKKIVFASSGATFGEPAQLPITEATPQHPESPYAITKMVGEHYLRFYKAQHGLEFTALRYGNVYGPRQDPSGEAGVISIFIGRFLAAQGVKIYWDGEQTRDYVYVGDVADANLLALDGGNGGMYVIGTGRKTSVNAIYRALVEVTGFEAPVERLPRRPGDVRDAQIDSSLAGRELGWTPRTSLLEGMKNTVEYFREVASERAAGK